jgi:demethylmenaquinone methyltransferase/2-methoxy-6-polyprenyl-1,4-benzoquinol methylase
MSKKVQDMFDSIAGKYDFLNHFLSGGRDLVWRKKSVARLPQNQQGRALDLCGGTGDFMQALHKQHPDLQGLVGDFSIEMMAVGKEKYPDFEWAQVDAQSTPFYNDRFQVVLNGFGMRNLDSLEKGIVEALRVTDGGGYFLTLEFFRPEKGFARFFYNVMAPLFIPLFGFLFSKKKAAYEYLVNSIRGFVSVDEYTDLCQQAGWEVVESISCDFGIAWGVLLRKPESLKAPEHHHDHDHDHDHNHNHE